MPGRTRRRKRSDHPPIVYIEWHDSRSLSSRWIDRQRVLDDAPTDFEACPISAGFLLEVTKRYMILALSASLDNDDVADVIQIPRSEIRRFEIIRKQRGGKWAKTKA